MPAVCEWAFCQAVSYGNALSSPVRLVESMNSERGAVFTSRILSFLCVRETLFSAVQFLFIIVDIVVL